MTALLIFTLILFSIPFIVYNQEPQVTVEEIEDEEPLWDDNKQHTENFF